jgi:hypothetical protein
MKKFVQTMTEGLPPRSYVLGFAAFAVVVLVGAAGVLAAFTWRVGDWHDPQLAAAFGEYRAHNVLMAIALAGIATWRAWAFNPALNGRYFQWLRTTPWTAPRPLPMGPVHLLWQDAVWVALAACLWTHKEGRVTVVLAFALPYAAVMARALFKTGSLWLMCGAAALGVSLLLTIPRPPWQGAAVAIGLCFYCDWAFRQALRQFPWDGRRLAWLQRETWIVSTTWPRLRDGGIVTNEPAISWRAAMAISLLVGWTALVIAVMLTWDVDSGAKAAKLDRQALLALAVVGIMASIARLGCYAGERSSPLGLWARWRLGRWILPGYDRVLIAPLATVVVAGSLPLALFALGAATPVVVGVTVACTLLTALKAPPTLAEWSLTGDYRLEVRRPGLPREWVRAG